MNPCIKLACLATLLTASASAADVTVYSTTIAQQWKQDTPGFDKSNFTTGTEYLGIDATNLGTEKLSMHLYGWGATDFQDQSSLGGKSNGNLTYGYLQYNFDQGNGVVKAGRFIINQGAGNEQLDGITGRTDLRGGFNISAFVGVPVAFQNLSNNPQSDISTQQNTIFGGRLGLRLGHIGEIGVSYLQDGGTANQNLSAPGPYDYTRRQAGADLHLAPTAWLDFSGRTVWDEGQHPLTPGAPAENRVAEDDYRVSVKLADSLSLGGTYVERNLFAYFAGSTLPNLFNMNDRGQFKATGASVTWKPLDLVQVVADVRRTDRENYGDTTRAGADLRFNFGTQHVLAGVGYHKVNAFAVTFVDPAAQSYSLSHSESRAWVMLVKGNWTASVDGIRLHYADPATNPDLNGKALESELVGSLGYQLTEKLKVSGDLTYEDTPIYQKQVMGLLRIEYRFGLGGK